jgi:hypothetical protein
VAAIPERDVTFSMLHGTKMYPIERILRRMAGPQLKTPTSIIALSMASFKSARSPLATPPFARTIRRLRSDDPTCQTRQPPVPCPTATARCFVLPLAPELPYSTADCVVDGGLVMRFVGTVSVIIGVGLCVSIIWAIIGFMAILFGLTCLLVAEKKAKRAHKSVLSAILKDERSKTRAALTKATKIQATPAFRIQAHDQTSASPLASPAATPDLSTAHDRLTAPREQNLTAEKTLMWEALCVNDPDIAHGVAMLAPYGKLYLDDFARAYLVFNDKEFLPLILKKIVAAAREDFGHEAIAQLDVEMPADRPVTHPQQRHAKSAPILHLVQRAAPNTPAEIPAEVAAPAQESISIERERLAKGDPLDHENLETDLRQSATISQMNMRDERPISAAPPSATGLADANDDLFNELRRLKATSKSTIVKAMSGKTAAATSTKTPTIKTAVPPSLPNHDPGLRTVPGREVGATALKVVASSPGIKSDARQFEGSLDVTQVAQIEEKVQQSIAVKIIGGAERKPVFIDEQDDADNFKFLLGKLV